MKRQLDKLVIAAKSSFERRLAEKQMQNTESRNQLGLSRKITPSKEVLERIRQRRIKFEEDAVKMSQLSLDSFSDERNNSIESVKVKRQYVNKNSYQYKSQQSQLARSQLGGKSKYMADGSNTMSS